MTGIAASPLVEDRLSAALTELRDLLGERLSTAAAVLEQHGRGEAYHAVRPPDAVAWATSTEEVAAIVRICRVHRLPVIPFGAGTALEGHIAALQGGVALDLSRMNAIVAVRPEDLDATVQAGVTRRQLNAHLRDTGLFFPVDPGAEATLGGMAATRASGTSAVRYGTMRENVLALTVVLADGTIVKTGTRARKSSAGYDLTRLFVGQEGTLGIITEVTLRLYGIPEAASAAVVAFPSVDEAVATAVETIQSGIPVARMELLDAGGIRAFNRWAKTDFAETATLFFEFNGTEAGVAEQAERVGEIAAANGGADFRWATSAQERNRLWEARHNFHYAMLAMRPGAKIWGTDACVPISRLGEVIGAATRDAASAPFPTAAIGHVGDGNFHMSYLIDLDDPAEVALVEGFNKRLVHHALAVGGTCTGEHGVGYGKAKFMVAEHGEAAIAVMRLLKQALDPDDILNPGKVLPRA